MDQISGTTPKDAPPQGPDDSQPAEGAPVEQPGFSSRGQARRRARFLRKARELAYRDLGGLVFNLHRFGQRNDALVLGKLATLGHIDAELRTIETALADRRPITVLREAGITACPRCAAIHGSEDRFCPNCGLPMARDVDLPVAGAPAGAAGGRRAPGAHPCHGPTCAGAQPLPGSAHAGARAPERRAGHAAGAHPEPAPSPGRERPPRRPAPTLPRTIRPDPSGAEAQHPAGHLEESTEIIHPQAPGSVSAAAPPGVPGAGPGSITGTGNLSEGCPLCGTPLASRAGVVPSLRGGRTDPPRRRSQLESAADRGRRAGGARPRGAGGRAGQARGRLRAGPTRDDDDRHDGRLHHDDRPGASTPLTTTSTPSTVTPAPSSSTPAAPPPAARPTSSAPTTTTTRAGGALSGLGGGTTGRSLTARTGPNGRGAARTRGASYG